METLSGIPKNMTASGQVKSTSGIIKGVVINSHTSGTLKFWNNTAGSGAILFNRYRNH